MNSKADRSDKLFPRRKIMFPRNTFIELTLSPNDVKKMKRWEEEGVFISVIWYANYSRVLFVDRDKFKPREKR